MGVGWVGRRGRTDEPRIQPCEKMDVRKQGGAFVAGGRVGETRHGCVEELPCRAAEVGF